MTAYTRIELCIVESPSTT